MPLGIARFPPFHPNAHPASHINANFMALVTGQCVANSFLDKLKLLFRLRVVLVQNL